MDWLRTNILEDHTTATEVKKIDLPTNPLSHLVITMDGYNATDEATLAEIIAFINTVKVSHLGTTIISLESEDLLSLTTYLFGKLPVLTQNVATDNAHRSLSLIVPFGRKLYNPLECYPGTKKGELTLTLDTTVPSSSLDNSTLNIDAVQLPGAKPTKHIKASTMSITAPGATGLLDIPLPIGNKYIAILAWLTTFPATSSHLYGIGDFALKLNDKEYRLSFGKTQCLVGEMQYRLNTLQRDIAAYGDIQPDNWVWMDFDANRDDSMLIDTKGASDVKLVANYLVDEAAKIVPVQLVTL